MSSYQYCWFEALDRLLTPPQQRELHGLSSRAKITSRTFENEYHFGSFAGKPLEMMKKYFDVHIYYACWATRVSMLKIPAKCVDLRRAKKYCTESHFKITGRGGGIAFARRRCAGMEGLDLFEDAE